MAGSCSAISRVGFGSAKTGTSSTASRITRGNEASTLSSIPLKASGESRIGREQSSGAIRCASAQRRSASSKRPSASRTIPSSSARSGSSSSSAGGARARTAPSASSLLQRGWGHSTRPSMAPQRWGSCRSRSSNSSSAISYSPSWRAVSASAASASRGSDSGVTSLGGGRAVGAVEELLDLYDRGLELLVLRAQELRVSGLRVPVHGSESSPRRGDADREMLAIEDVHRGGLIHGGVEDGVQLAIEANDAIAGTLLDGGGQARVHILDAFLERCEGDAGGLRVPRPLAGWGGEEGPDQQSRAQPGPHRYRR